MTIGLRSKRRVFATKAWVEDRLAEMNRKQIRREAALKAWVTRRLRQRR